MREHSDLYADAFFNIISSEGNLNEVQDELFRFARIVEGNEELASALNDPHLPVARRAQIVEDVLEGKSHQITVALVSMLVVAGRFKDLGKIVDKLLRLSASLTQRSIAEVRSAVELTAEQKGRLAESLKQRTGQDVEVVVVVDPNLLGGLVTQIGDTVIDGSVRHRLAQLKESF
jgi:F-type H+-transporting ATPase subunit delta